jgi:hypothetical protein
MVVICLSITDEASNRDSQTHSSTNRYDVLGQNKFSLSAHFLQMTDLAIAHLVLLMLRITKAITDSHL